MTSMATMTNQERAALINRYIAAYNALDVEGMVSCMHPDVEFTNIYRGRVNAQTKGLNAFRDLAMQTRSIFSSRKQTPAGFTHGPELTEAAIDFIGVVAQDFPGGPSQGDVIQLKGKTEFTFQDGLLRSIKDES